MQRFRIEKGREAHIWGDIVLRLPVAERNIADLLLIMEIPVGISMACHYWVLRVVVTSRSQHRKMSKNFNFRIVMICFAIFDCKIKAPEAGGRSGAALPKRSPAG